MMQRLIMMALLVLSFAGLAGTQQVFAKDLFNGDGNSHLCADEAANSVVCQDKTDKNPVTGQNGLFIKIANIIAYVAGAAAVIVMIVSSIRYITSGGDSGKIASAKGALINSAVGLLIVVLAKFLITYVLGKI
jgi:hypothetical protein